MSEEASYPPAADEVDSVLRDIALQNLQLRRLATVLLVDVEFLRLCEIFDEIERALQRAYCSNAAVGRHSSGSETEDIISLLELKVRLLRRSGRGCLQRIANYNETRKGDASERQQSGFTERLETALAQLTRKHKNFRESIIDVIWSLGDIYLLREVESLLKGTDFLHAIVCNNHQNGIHSLPTTNIDHTIELSCVRLRFAVSSLLIIALVHFRELLETMESEDSVRALHAKLQQEIRRSLDEAQVNEEELASLRQKLFTSADSLTVQRNIAIEKRETRGLELQEQLRTIDLLELDRQEIEGRVTQLIEQREAIQKQLDERRALLQDGLHEIVRLEHLIEQIEREISERKVRFQQEAQQLEQRRLDILNDPSLSPEERQRLLAECDAQQQLLRQSHTSNINLLEARCDELKRQSKSLANDVEAFRGEVAQKQNDKLAELERQKQLATTPSQIALIEAQIQQQRAEFSENFTMLDRAKDRTEYFTDEHGRYYVNEAGVRIYKRDSTASEYQLGPDGEWVKVASAIALQSDEHGTFYVDKFGQKIYQRQQFTDAKGTYYLDENGTRVYQTPIGSPSSDASDSEFMSLFHRTLPPSASSQSSLVQCEEYPPASQSMQELRERVAIDVAYIQQTVGVVLRKGLAALTRAKPDDPIGYLADYLKLFQRNALETKRQQELLERLRLEAADVGMENITP
uniref:Uncharacterized protein n=1 Tax=Anopheles quadriannulatus TaxID=34691 RepID=A0A182X185_ANOQN